MKWIRCWGWLIAAWTLALSAHGAPAPWAGVTRTFDFASDRYLLPGRSHGALVYVTRGVAEGEAAPVVVFLHGLNPTGTAHPWFTGNQDDLRYLADKLVAEGKVAPFVLAAPSQSRNATIPQVLWPDFDVDAFLDATDTALGGRAPIDRHRVILVGHSGGGCNPRGGIIGAGSRAAIPPVAVLAVDTCLDPMQAQGLLGVHEETKVHVFWQRAMWSRPFDAFRQQLEGARGERLPRERRCEEVKGLTGFAHDRILPAVLSKELPVLLPPAKPEGVPIR